MYLTLNEVTSEIIDKRGVTVKKLGGEFVEDGHRVISAKLIKKSKVDLDAGEKRFVNHKIYKKWMSSKLQEGDVILTSEAPLGEVAYIKENLDWCLGQRLFCLRPNREIIDGRYLYYALKTKQVQADLESRGTGTTVIGIRQSELLNVQIPIQDLETQKRISNLLGGLDDKIELNQQMNENLEEIARTLFKSWFIDFDPVRAKAEGRPTGLSKEISDLFPDSFEDSELGEIPRGWSKSIITDIANKISDKYKKDEGWSNEKLIDLSRMPSNSISLTSHGRGDELSTSVCKFKKYDFLFGSIRPYFYKAGICPYDGVSNTSVFILRAKKSYDKEFMYFYSSSDITFERSVQYSDGTKMPIIKWNDFKEFPFALPNEELRKQFSSIINPVVDKIILNIDEQKVLSELRDALLPRLISGELQITDAENLVEEAGI